MRWFPYSRSLWDWIQNIGPLSISAGYPPSMSVLVAGLQVGVGELKGVPESVSLEESR